MKQYGDSAPLLQRMFVTGCHRSCTSLGAALVAALRPKSQLEQRSIVSGPDNPVGSSESAPWWLPTIGS